jgi:hypothetical protein
VTQIVLPEVDQRILLGQLAQRSVQRHAVGRMACDDHGLQRRR